MTSKSSEAVMIPLYLNILKTIILISLKTTEMNTSSKLREITKLFVTDLDSLLEGNHENVLRVEVVISSKSSGHLILLPSEIEDFNNEYRVFNKKYEKSCLNSTKESIKLENINSQKDNNESKQSPIKSMTTLHSKNNSNTKQKRPSVKEFMLKDKNKINAHVNKLLKKSNKQASKTSRNNIQIKSLENEPIDSQMSNFMSKIRSNMKHALAAHAGSQNKFKENSDYFKEKDDSASNLPNIKLSKEIESTEEAYHQLEPTEKMQSDIQLKLDKKADALRKKYMKGRSSRVLSSIYSQSHASSSEMKTRNANEEKSIKIEPKSRFNQHEDGEVQLSDEAEDDECRSSDVYFQTPIQKAEDVKIRTIRNPLSYIFDKQGNNTGMNMINKIELNEMNPDLNINMQKEPNTNRLQNLFRLSVRYFEDKLKLPLISHRNSHVQLKKNLK